MFVSYYEAAALAHVEAGPRGELTLDQFHKRVWALFVENNPAAKDLTQRPFVFRFDPYKAGRFLLTIRSDRPFHGAVERRLPVEAGASVTFDLCWVPTRRNGRREYAPPENEWPGQVTRMAGNAGVEIQGEPKIRLVTTIPQNDKMVQRTNRMPVATARVTGTIADEELFASAFLDGVGRKKGYGMGLIRLTSDSEIASEKAA